MVVSGGASSASDSGRQGRRGAGRGQAGQEMAATLHDMHRSLLLSFRGSRALPVAHAFSSRLSSFRKRQSVPSAMSLLGVASIMSDLVQPERVEPQRVLRVELAPDVVGQLGQRLERVVVVLREAAIDQAPRGPLRLGGADIGGLEDGAHRALGRDRMVPDELRVARPGYSRSTATMAGPLAMSTITWPILRARSSCGSGHESRGTRRPCPATNSSIGLATSSVVTQLMSLSRVQPDMGRHDRHVTDAGPSRSARDADAACPSGR